MGNRAVITTSTSKTTGVGIYVHWNGGPESVRAFLDACRARGYRDPESDAAYAMARLCGLICQFFGGSDSVGIGQLRELDCDNWDNGVYVIGKDWRVVNTWGKGSGPVADVYNLSAAQEQVHAEILNHLTKQGE